MGGPDHRLDRRVHAEPVADGPGPAPDGPLGGAHPPGNRAQRQALGEQAEQFDVLVAERLRRGWAGPAGEVAGSWAGMGPGRRLWLGGRRSPGG